MSSFIKAPPLLSLSEHASSAEMQKEDRFPSESIEFNAIEIGSSNASSSQSRTASRSSSLVVFNERASQDEHEDEGCPLHLRISLHEVGHDRLSALGDWTKGPGRTVYIFLTEPFGHMERLKYEVNRYHYIHSVNIMAYQCWSSTDKTNVILTYLNMYSGGILKCGEERGALEK